MALFLDVGPEDKLQLGNTTITIVHKSGRRARLRIEGKDDVQLVRPDGTSRSKDQQPDGRTTE